MNTGKEARRSKLDAAELKSGGFIMQTQRDLFTVRLRCPGGKLSAAQLRKAAELADKYGRGEVHTSFRQSIEIPYVHFDNIDLVAAELKEANWALASCGPRLRVPTACAGCTWNPRGLMDTQTMCAEVDQRFFGTPTGHHKFKLSFAGCPLDCPRTREMDLGFQGIVEPKLLEGLCNACGLCVSTCEEKALTMVDNLPIRDLGQCNYCGDCIKVCPIEAMLAKRKGWLVRVGGKHGKHPYYSYEVARFVQNEECFALIEKTLEWYRTNAKDRERIGITIERLGLGKYLNEVVKPLGMEVIESLAERRKFHSRGNLYS